MANSDRKPIKGHGRLSEIGEERTTFQRGEKKIERAYFCLVRTGKKFFNQVNIVDKLGLQTERFRLKCICWKPYPQCDDIWR